MTSDDAKLIVDALFQAVAELRKPRRYVVDWSGDTGYSQPAVCVEAYDAKDAIVRAAFRGGVVVRHIRPLRPNECPLCVNGEELRDPVCSTCGRNEQMRESDFGRRRRL